MKRINLIDTLKKQLIELLKCNLLPEKSYLAGGTAVYFYLKHRISIDLDFFTPTNFNSEILIYRLRNCFRNVSVELMEKDSVILYISEEKIKFSLFFFPYKLLSEVAFLEIADSIVCPTASLEDIASMKAVAISQRGSARDYIDLYFLLKKTNYNFADILEFVLNKFGLQKEYEYHLKTSFVYFDDAEKEVDNILLVKDGEKINKISVEKWQEIKKFFYEFIK
jgi:predicted nucleotidyltransferase component of viral defense system